MKNGSKETREARREKQNERKKETIPLKQKHSFHDKKTTDDVRVSFTVMSLSEGGGL